MGTLALNKSSLKGERDRLKTYQRFLPSLDLKRQQLMVEFKKAGKVLEIVRQENDEFAASLGGLLPLLGATAMNLADYVKVRNVVIGEENIVGVRLPVLQDMDFQHRRILHLGQTFLGRHLDRMCATDELAADPRTSPPRTLCSVGCGGAPYHATG